MFDWFDPTAFLLGMLIAAVIWMIIILRRKK